MRLQNDKRVDHRLVRVYRFGTGAVGVILLAFGIAGFLDELPFFGTAGKAVAGLSTNGLLSTISIVVAAILLAAAVIGGQFASNTSIVLGALFFLSGLVNYGLMWTSANFLNFRLSNVVFSFVVGLVLAEFGMYGRFTAGLPHDNPYWRARHPDQALQEENQRAEHAAGSAAPAAPAVPAAPAAPSVAARPRLSR
ncbi:MAG TPA: DUF4383 domain-containing protein [Actinocrinis sp.]|jgi:hypothetical protein